MTGIDGVPPVRVPLAALPEPAMPVRLHGAIGRAEVGGSFCFGVAVTVAVAKARP